MRALPTSHSLVLFPQRAHATTESVAAILTRIGKPEHVRLDSRRLRTTWAVGHFVSLCLRLLSHSLRA